MGTANEEASSLAEAALSVYRDVTIGEAAKDNDCLREENNALEPFRELLDTLKIYSFPDLLAEANLHDGSWMDPGSIGIEFGDERNSWWRVPLSEIDPLSYGELYRIRLERGFYLLEWLGNTFDKFLWVHGDNVYVRIPSGPGVYIVATIEDYTWSLEKVEKYIRSGAWQWLLSNQGMVRVNPETLEPLNDEDSFDRQMRRRPDPFRNARVKFSGVWFNTKAAQAAHLGTATRSNATPVILSEELTRLKSYYTSHSETQTVVKANEHLKKENLTLKEAKKLCRTITLDYRGGSLSFDLTKGSAKHRFRRDSKHWVIEADMDSPSVPITELPLADLTIGNVSCGRFRGESQLVRNGVFILIWSVLECHLVLVCFLNEDLFDAVPESELHTVGTRLRATVLGPNSNSTVGRFGYANAGLEGVTARILSLAIDTYQNASLERLLNLFELSTEGGENDDGGEDAQTEDDQNEGNDNDET